MKPFVFILGGVALPFLSPTSGSVNTNREFIARWKKESTRNGTSYYKVTFEDSKCRSPFYPLLVWANQMTILEYWEGDSNQGYGKIRLTSRSFRETCQKVWLTCKFRAMDNYTIVLYGNNRLQIPSDLIYRARTSQRYQIYYSGLQEGSIEVNQWLADHIQRERNA